MGSFADDTKMLSKIDISEDYIVMQHELQNVIKWSISNNMMLHKDKFVYLRYKTNRSKVLSELPFTAELAEYTNTSGHVFVSII